MSRLFRYLFGECAKAALLALTILTILVLLPQFLILVDLWINKGVDIAVLVEMTLLSIPKLLIASLPMSLLVGILLTLGRMSQESEIVVMKAGGISLMQMGRPIALLVFLWGTLAFLLACFWVPHTRGALLRLSNAVISTTTLSIRAQTFNHAVAGLTIFVHEKSADGQLLKGILIHDQRDGENSATFIAQTGQLYQKPNGESALLLHDGSLHRAFANGGYRKLDFSSYDLELGITQGLQFRANQEDMVTFSMEELNEAMHDRHPERAFEARMEWHRRFALPTATLILGMLALPLGIQSHRGGRGYSFIVALLTLVIHFLLLTIGEALARKQFIDPITGFWLPNLLMTGMTGYILWQTSRERSFLATEYLSRLVVGLPLKLLRPGPLPPAD